MRVGMAALALIALAACAGPPSAVQTASSAAHKAADQFVTLATGSATSGQVPRQTDPTAGPLLDAVFNTQAVQGATGSAADMQAVNDWLLSAVRVGQVYMLAGTGLTDISGATTTQAQTRVLQNMITYAPECGRYYDAELAIEGADATGFQATLAANPGAAKDPQTTQGVAEAQGGLAQTAQGVIATIGPTGLPNDWREARAQALIALAPHVVGFLTDAQKQTLNTAATQAAASSDDPQLAALLNQFAAAIVAKPAS
jgi:hypothetical protein